MPILESGVGRLVTLILQAVAAPAGMTAAAVTTACGRASVVRRSQGVSARAGKAARNAKANPAAAILSPPIILFPLGFDG
jgi:hypothetical protein